MIRTTISRKAVLGLSAAVLAMAGAATAQTYHAPRTAYGQPDLQGNWTNATITPF